MEWNGMEIHKRCSRCCLKIVTQKKKNSLRGNGIYGMSKIRVEKCGNVEMCEWEKQKKQKLVRRYCRWICPRPVPPAVAVHPFIDLKKWMVKKKRCSMMARGRGTFCPQSTVCSKL
jgi:hypothetical protein